MHGNMISNELLDLVQDLGHVNIELDIYPKQWLSLGQLSKTY